MKKIKKICIIIIFVFVIYTIICFGFRRVKILDNGIKYRGEEYNYCDLFRPYDFYDNQKMVSLGFIYYFPLWSITYYGTTRNCPDIILSPRSYSVYTRTNFDPKSIVCSFFIEKYIENEYKKIVLGEMSLDDIIDCEVDEINYKKYGTLTIWIYSEYYNIITDSSLIIDENNIYYLSINGHIYTITDDFKVIIYNYNYYML